MEGGSFFAMLFGSDQFEHLVGELLITAAARCGATAEHGRAGVGLTTRVEGGLAALHAAFQSTTPVTRLMKRNVRCGERCHERISRW